MRKKFLIYTLMFMLTCVSCMGLAQSSDKKLRIACIGNSITYGFKLEAPRKYSYPAVLQQLLGADQVRVKNFGIPGATMIRYSSPNVWKELDGIKQYLPQVAIIMIGTNETVSGKQLSWEHVDAFEKDYSNFLLQLKSLSSHPVIFICSPTDINLKTSGLSEKRLNDLVLRRPRLWELRKTIKKIARESDVHFIDATRYFKNKPLLFTNGDGVHPNKQGYHYLAELIYRNIKKSLILLSKE